MCPTARAEPRDLAETVINPILRAWPRCSARSPHPRRARARRARPQRPEASDEEIAALRAELQSRLDHLRALFNKDRRAGGLPDDTSGGLLRAFGYKRPHEEAKPTAPARTVR